MKLLPQPFKLGPEDCRRHQPAGDEHNGSRPAACLQVMQAQAIPRHEVVALHHRRLGTCHPASEHQNQHHTPPQHHQTSTRRLKSAGRNPSANSVTKYAPPPATITQARRSTRP